MERKHNELERTYIIDKDSVISALESGCRVYYVERGSQNVYEFTLDDPVKELAKAETLFAVKKEG